MMDNNLEFKSFLSNSTNNEKKFNNRTTSFNDLEELQSTALIKQNRKPIPENSTNGSQLLKQTSMINSSLVETEKNNQSKLENLFVSNSNENEIENKDLIQSTTQQQQRQSNEDSFKEDKEDNLFNCNQFVQTDNDQMSPSSSSTSAYVSLYASSSFSSACSSSSNYSSGFNENNNSKESNRHSMNDSLSKKISRSAILDSLINKKHNNKLLDKPFDRSLMLKSDEKIDLESNEANKIVIDVSTNNSGNYDSLNQSVQNEHIYEELNCGFEREREINIIDNVNNNLNTVKKSIFNGASKDEILGYLVDAKESKF